MKDAALPTRRPALLSDRTLAKGGSAMFQSDKIRA